MPFPIKKKKGVPSPKAKAKAPVDPMEPDVDDSGNAAPPKNSGGGLPFFNPYGGKKKK